MIKKQTITIRANEEVIAYIKAEANRQGISTNALINILLTEVTDGRKRTA